VQRTGVLFRGLAIGLLLGGASARPALAAPVSYADLSDAALDDAVGQWADLSVDERRALLTEIHHRMAAAGKRPVLRLRTERRFGYRVEQPDGRVVRIERRQQVIRYRSLDPDAGFGVGFERRTGQPLVRPASAVVELLPESSAAPVAPSPEGPLLPVPAAGGTPVFQLPVSEVRVPERPQ
jgi:hypothetical protein